MGKRKGGTRGRTRPSHRPLAGLSHVVTPMDQQPGHIERLIAATFINRGASRGPLSHTGCKGASPSTSFDFLRTDRILLVGEGDFSFALALGMRSKVTVRQKGGRASLCFENEEEDDEAMMICDDDHDCDDDGLDRGRYFHSNEANKDATRG